MFPSHYHHNHLDERLSAMCATLVIMLETALKPPALSLSARATLSLSCSSPSPWKAKGSLYSTFVVLFWFFHSQPGRGNPIPQAHVDTVQIPSQGTEGSLSPDLFNGKIVKFTILQFWMVFVQYNALLTHFWGICSVWFSFHTILRDLFGTIYVDTI